MYSKGTFTKEPILLKLLINSKVCWSDIQLPTIAAARSIKRDIANRHPLPASVVVVFKLYYMVKMFTKTNSWLSARTL